jgi:hypothetical protein
MRLSLSRDVFSIHAAGDTHNNSHYHGDLSPPIVLHLSLDFPDNESRGDCVAQIISSGGELGRSDKSSVPTQEAFVAERLTT